MMVYVVMVMIMERKTQNASCEEKDNGKLSGLNLGEW
jgi:hypothetical protein